MQCINNFFHLYFLYFQQRSQQTSTALKADFAESTVSRRQQQQSSTVSKMTSSTMESSSSTQQVILQHNKFHEILKKKKFVNSISRNFLINSFCLFRCLCHHHNLVPQAAVFLPLKRVSYPPLAINNNSDKKTELLTYMIDI